MLKITCIMVTLAVLSGCAVVRQQDIDAWVGQPVEALDTQRFFITLPMVKTISDSGIEIRNYVNGANVGRCFQSGSVSAYTVNYANYIGAQNCINQFAACNNIFYIKDGKVLEYAPTPSGGIRCYTDDLVLPNTKYLSALPQ